MTNLHLASGKLRLFVHNYRLFYAELQKIVTALRETFSSLRLQKNVAVVITSRLIPGHQCLAWITNQQVVVKSLALIMRERENILRGVYVQRQVPLHGSVLRMVDVDWAVNNDLETSVLWTGRRTDVGWPLSWWEKLEKKSSWILLKPLKFKI